MEAVMCKNCEVQSVVRQIMVGIIIGFIPVAIYVFFH